jgi:sigma-54 dependent transcriptional regulator, acetoin dehydrogenase operon transcriptional activator AcoR
MPQTSGDHSRLVYSVIRGGARRAEGPEYVKRSWLRCVDEYGLDPESRKLPTVVSRQELITRKERHSDLVAFADAEISHLHRQLAGSGHSILLTDLDAVVLSYYGDASFMGAATKTGLLPGAVWSERQGGTNGMGTCLAEREPLIVHREQHFLSRNTGLTCCAAPIFDHRGELLAALDVSAESDRAQQHTLVLVNMSAQTIENRLFLHRFRDAFVVRFHSRPELIGTWSEGIIALDMNGAIAGVDRNALFQLGWKTAQELVNSPLERAFNISLPALLRRSRSRSFHPLPIYEARHGGRFFAVAQEPESVRRALRAAKTSLRDRGAAVPATSALDQLNLGDPAMAHNVRAAKRVALRDIPVLLIGETGTGKENFARALHAASPRAQRPFIAVTSASLSAPLLQAEIAAAQGGTLFLAKVGELTAPLQAALLDVLERREALQSATTSVRIDVRVIAATSATLEDKVRHGEFREDLFYRLQGLVLTLPALRERRDKRALVRQLFAEEAADAPSVRLSEPLIDHLCAHRWPGNLRQLRNALRTMIARRSRDELAIADLPADHGLGATGAKGAASAANRLNTLEKAEREVLLRELELEHCNLSRLARKLGVSRNALYRKMHRLAIPWPMNKE